MKTLNHVHLGALNVVRSMDFYCRHLGFEKVADHGEGVFLKNGQGFLIAIDPVDDVGLPGWFHVGFCQDSPPHPASGGCVANRLLFRAIPEPNSMWLTSSGSVSMIVEPKL